ncbi:DUF1707 domain-containing protein [Streptomyces sp. NPDC048636]|uniref:DUF1707 SHOCT-like domain-containing protein n=1 Tax=Streptomyces sp. NPDC048636 TaxID=3155762 RepID=UPI00344A18F0
MTEIDRPVMDPERDAAAAVLSDHYSLGTLSKDNFDDRLAAVFAAGTVAELRDVLDGLPVHHVEPAPTARTPSARHHRRRRAETESRGADPQPRRTPSPQARCLLVARGPAVGPERGGDRSGGPRRRAARAALARRLEHVEKVVTHLLRLARSCSAMVMMRSTPSIW